MPSTAGIIAARENCYRQIFQSAVAEIGTSNTVAAILATQEQHTGARYAYLALRVVRNLTSKQRDQLIAKTDSFYAYLALREVKDLTSEQRDQLIAKAGARYSYLALCKIVDLTNENV